MLTSSPAPRPRARPLIPISAALLALLPSCVADDEPDPEPVDLRIEYSRDWCTADDLYISTIISTPRGTADIQSVVTFVQTADGTARRDVQYPLRADFQLEDHDDDFEYWWWGELFDGDGGAACATDLEEYLIVATDIHGFEFHHTFE